MANVAAGAAPIAGPPPIRDWRRASLAVSSLHRILSDLVGLAVGSPAEPFSRGCPVMEPACHPRARGPEGAPLPGGLGRPVRPVGERGRRDSARQRVPKRD
jgi:hypothetical protein